MHHMHAITHTHPYTHTHWIIAEVTPKHKHKHNQLLVQISEQLSQLGDVRILHVSCRTWGKGCQVLLYCTIIPMFVNIFQSDVMCGHGADGDGVGHLCVSLLLQYLLCVAERRATRPNGEWGYSTRRHMLGPERPEAVSAGRGVILTDLQSSIDCQYTSLSLTHTHTLLHQHS
jgi:hypothetical protein